MKITKGEKFPTQYQNEDLQLRVFNFNNAGRDILKRYSIKSVLEIEAFKNVNGPNIEEENSEPGEFRFYDLNDVWGLAANALRDVFTKVL